MKKVFKKEDIDTVADELLAALGVKKGSGATVVALSGDLGAGKTTLTQAVARRLGVAESVISPTFVIMKAYDAKHGAYARLVHIDAYRLNSSAELERLGWAELIADPKNLILIEWPERVPEALPADAHRVTLSHLSEEEREILIVID